MPVDNTRYRRVEFLGARILQARELLQMQRIDRGFDTSNQPTAYELGAVYREGATLNVTVGIVNKDVTLSATDGTKPMLIFVRGKWEKLKTAEAPMITFSVGETNLYLNWVLKKITSAQDATLIDATTLEETANMGELQLSVSKTDTSAVGLAGDELEKNTTPIILFIFTHAGATMTLNSPISAGIGDKGNVKDQALADNKTAGLVHLSTGTSDGKAVADDDTRMSDARAPLALSVEDSKVRVPVTTGNTNADGTAEYTIPASGGTDPGGISAAKVILLTAKQTLEAGWNWLKTKVLAVESAFNSHKTLGLGVASSHPMPTAQEVGAAPLSHVGQPLGLASTHPPTAAMDTGGYRLTRNVVARVADDYAYAVLEGATILTGMDHTGDVFSILADAQTAPATDGDGALVNTGAIGHLSKLAAVLAEHINKTSHKNPHGLTASDLSAATVAYVDTADQNVLSSAIAYAELIGSIAVRTEHVLGAVSQHDWGRAPGGSQQAYIDWAVFTLGGKFEVAIGTGQFYHAGIVPTPAGSWGSSSFIGQAAPAWMKIDYDEDSPANWNFSFNNTTHQVTALHSSKEKGFNLPQWAGVTCIAWRSITAPPVLISLSPSSAAVAATVTITGRNFGSTLGQVAITVGGTPATATSVNPTTIQFTVPSVSLGSKTVAVTINGVAAVNNLTLTVV